ncbi:MAG: DUF2156 domain-containing protein [Chloroflexi bacterium]|nr:DUF2156 domain-containing protein [Chloroflexota bacterium]
MPAPILRARRSIATTLRWPWLAETQRPPTALLAAYAPAVALVVASVSADLVALTGRDVLGLWAILPAGRVAGSWLAAETSSTILLLIAIALARAKRLGFWLGLAALTAAILDQGLVGHHPLAGLAALALAVVLLGTRDRYAVQTGAPEIALALSCLGAGLLAAIAGSLAEAWPRPDLPGMGLAVATWLDGGTIEGSRLAAPSAAALVIARVAYVAGAVLALAPAEVAIPAGELTRRLEVLRRQGRGALLPYQAGPLARPVVDADGTAVLAFARSGRIALVLGDPAGSDARVRALVAGWLAECRLRDWLPAVYQATDRFRDRLVADGWHAWRVGAEAILDPVAFDLGLPRLANVRHTVRRAERASIRTECWGPGGAEPMPARLAGLVALDADWRRRAGVRIGFTVGVFDPDALEGAIVTIGIDADEAVAAFVVLRPTGADGGWMLDVMRRGGRAAPGAVEACLVRAIEQLSGMGVRRLSLGLAPLYGLRVREGPLVERLLALAADVMRPIYDVRGLGFFKDKLDPRWEPRWLVVPHRQVAVGAAIALVKLHLGGSWPRVAGSLLAPLRRRAAAR